MYLYECSCGFTAQTATPEWVKHTCKRIRKAK